MNWRRHHRTNMKAGDRYAEWISRGICSAVSIFPHTSPFWACFQAVFLGEIRLPKMLLWLTTIVSLEAIYIGLFLQDSSNRRLALQCRGAGQHDLILLELKRASTPDKAIGQITRYMGWVMESLAEGKPVYGVIVAGEISANLKYAILAIPNVRLFEYQISFTLKPAAHAVS
jgi:hypothetical protein